MKKLLAIVIVLVVAPVLYAQPSDPPPSAASLKYSEFRKQSTDPLYSVSKIKALIKKIKRNQDDNMVLPDKTYNSLTFKEKLSFALLHGEDFSQNCSDVPQLTDEHKKLFAYYPGPFGDEAVWSDRQRAFLDNNRTKVIAMLRDTIKARKRIGVNLKQAIVYLKATSLIPDAIAVYNRDKKDHDILTMFMVMMDEAKYIPFLETGIYKTLYGEEANYKAFIPYNKANEQIILNMAVSFSKSK